MFVSIHHMCRFKLVIIERQLVLIGFNTSYVSVQDATLRHNVESKKFQYIICVGSRNFIALDIRAIITVSIHHMCRFKRSLYPKYKYSYSVSIHHMCRFKFFSFKAPKSISFVSIHHMCRFKKSLEKRWTMR